MLPLTSHLGFWQLDRAEQKWELLKEQELRSASVAENIDVRRVSEFKRFQKFKVDGVYLNEMYLLDNRQREGVPGYEVLSLFELVSGGLILVNRGWIEAPKYRTALPRITTTRDLISLEGYFYWPDKKVPVLDSSDNIEPLGDGLARIQSVDWPQVREQAENLLVDREFRLAGVAEPGALVAEWQYSSIRPEKHTGYAFQWFALSIALLLLGAWASYRVKSE